MIRTTITHIGQNLDLKKRSFDHTIKLQLPDGSIINATIDEQAVERLMKFVADDGPQEEEAAPAQTQEQPGMSEDAFVNGLYDGASAHVFGGPVEQQDAPEEDGQLPLPIPKPSGPVQVVHPQPVRIKTVPKDEYGFPIVSPSGVNAGSVLAEMHDDDGVPQI